MNNIKELLVLPKEPDYYNNYIVPNEKLQIDPARIDLSILTGEERNIIKTPITGDSSLVLRYNQKEGAVLSMAINSTDLTILQLQGAKSRESYKIATAFRWVSLFSDQIIEISNHPNSFLRRIVMPSFWEINGLCDSSSEYSVGRYRQLANNLQLRFSQESNKYIKELKINL